MIKRLLCVIPMALALMAFGSVTLAHDDVGAVPESRGHLGGMGPRAGMCKFAMCFNRCSYLSGGSGFQNICATRCARHGCT